MDWGWGLVAYGALWWMVLVTLLPWGRRREKKPGLALKAALAVPVSALLWGILYAVAAAGVISFE